MASFKNELRVLIAFVVAFVAAYGINSFFNSLLEACGNKNMIKARVWYMLAVTGLAIAVIFILVEYPPDDDDDDNPDGNKNIKDESEFSGSPLRRKLLKDK